jgi:hypothetical protein
MVQDGVYDQVRRLYDLLERGVSYDIAGQSVSLPHYAKDGSEVWGPLSNRGVKKLLSNPIWYGYRCYREAAQGEEYQPVPRTPSAKPPKKRRKRIARGAEGDWSPSNGAARGELLTEVQLHNEAGEPIGPLMTKAEWDRKQELIFKRSCRRMKTRSPADRFLGRKVLQCLCGDPFYCRPGAPDRSGHDYYYCRSMYHKPIRKRIAKPCGFSQNYRRDIVDNALRALVTQHLLNTKLMAQILRQTDKDAKVIDKAAQERAALLADRRGQRQRILDDQFKGKQALLTHEEARERLKPIEAEIRALEALVRVDAPPQTAKAFVQMIADYFAGFELLPIEKQEELLERAVSLVILSGRSIISMTLKGGFLEAFANKRTHSCVQSPSVLESAPTR